MDVENPAALAIRLLGAKRIAAHCDLTTDAVWKWPKRDGGTIPARYQRAIHDLAQTEGKPITPAEIIGVDPAPEAAQ